MRIRMRDQISGTRDGVPWPPPGGEIDVSDAEGVKYCANGLASPVAVDEKVEKAVDETPVEKLDAPARRGRPPGSKNKPKTDEE